jgi:hypothetical protein
MSFKDLKVSNWFSGSQNSCPEPCGDKYDLISTLKGALLIQKGKKPAICVKILILFCKSCCSGEKSLDKKKNCLIFNQKSF